MCCHNKDKHEHKHDAASHSHDGHEHSHDAPLRYLVWVSWKSSCPAMR